MKLQTVQSSLVSWSIKKFLKRRENSLLLRKTDILLKLTEEVKFRSVLQFLQFSIIYLLEQAYRLTASVLLYQGNYEEACDCIKAADMLNAKHDFSCFCFTFLYFAEVHLYPGFFPQHYFDISYC